ncbi:MAG TPA: VWA domain-containing protein, partial [Armatimonadetes bacterium]|nr:VWA domain-containing protein [Armatimonadota bacterium]
MKLRAYSSRWCNLVMAFAQPLFILWGIVAGALPIVIHLLAQRRRQRIQFPTLRFLEAAAIEAHGHKRLREWLIVALRALALLMFFIALSRPIAMVGWMPTLLRDTAIIIVLDDSYSMSFRDGDESRFQRALNASRVLLRQWQYALIGLIYASTPERLRVALTNKHAGVQAVLRTSGVQWTEGYIQGAIQTAQRILNAHDAVDKHVVVFTDGQFLRNITHRDWREHSSTSKMNRTMDVILAPKVTIVDVRREFDDVNVGLRDWRIDAPITGLEPTLLRITLHNFGSKVWKGSISAKVDGKPLPDIVTLTIPPQADATVTFSLPIS